MLCLPASCTAAPAPTPAAPSKAGGEAAGSEATPAAGGDQAMADLEVDDPEASVAFALMAQAPLHPALAVRLAQLCRQLGYFSCQAITAT